MTDELKPVRCGCGGEAEVCKSPLKDGYCYFVKCERCETATNIFVKVEDAIMAWNRAMSGSAEEKLKAFWDGMSAEMKEERTAKVMNDGVNYCENCEGYVEAPMAYCPYCGCRLEWK